MLPTLFDGVQKFAPLNQDAAKAHWGWVGERWSVEETYLKGTVVEVLFREHRAAEAAAAFFRSSVESRG
jgi:transposase-like protein